MKTSELTGAALDWAVAKCEHNSRRHNYGSPCFDAKTKRVYETEGVRQIGVNFAPSTDWAQGGPIIERECIFIAPTWDGENAGSSARVSRTAWIEGPTPLIAAMRCYVASKLGDTVDIPKELQ